MDNFFIMDMDKAKIFLNIILLLVVFLAAVFFGSRIKTADRKLETIRIIRTNNGGSDQPNPGAGAGQKIKMPAKEEFYESW